MSIYSVTGYNLLVQLLAEAPSNNECMVWPRCKDNRGYGIVRLGTANKNTLVHRLAFALANGPIPGGLDVCHSCDNPPCFRPSHLWLGTHRDNMRDMGNKGRANTQPIHHVLFAETNGKTVLTTRQVQEIRHLVKHCGHKQCDVAVMFHVARPTISNIVTGKRRIYTAEDSHLQPYPADLQMPTDSQ